MAHVHLHFKSPNSKALEYFKKLRDAATEDQDHHTKTIAFNEMGQCYKRMQDYGKAVVCFKK